MKSFQEYLQESWKKRRGRDRIARQMSGNQMAEYFGTNPLATANKKLIRVSRASDNLSMKAYEEGSSQSDQAASSAALKKKVELINKNNASRIYRSAKALGYKPSSGFGNLLHSINSQTADDSFSYRHVVEPLLQNFDYDAKIKATMGRSISSERNNKERANFENLIKRTNDPSTSERTRNILSGHLNRNSTRMRKLGIQR